MFFRRALILGLLSVLPSFALADTRLDISFHRQEHTLSCEVATLKMALSTHGISVSEEELIQRLPFDPTPKGNGIWGDPNHGFVGNINGQMLRDGYGVYWNPIAEVGDHYTRTKIIRHGSAASLATEVSRGNPVIIWGYYGRRQVYNWRTSSNQTIKAVNGEHTRVVYGFDGTPENPTRFHLLDPLNGSLTWSTAQLMYNWSALNHMAVAVLPPSNWVRVPGETMVWELNPKNNTRHWITTWSAFVNRGGTSRAIEPISSSQLLRYNRGGDII